MIVTVAYGRVTDMDRARRCRRCDRGQERFGPRAGRPCPRCSGTGVRPDGYTYLAPASGEPIALGDVVECPPTPYSAGRPVLATVIDREGEAFPGKPIKTIIRRVGSAWPITEPENEATR